MILYIRLLKNSHKYRVSADRQKKKNTSNIVDNLSRDHKIYAFSIPTTTPIWKYAHQRTKSILHCNIIKIHKSHKDHVKGLR